MPWRGPYKLRDLIDRPADDDRYLPTDDVGVYVVTRARWEGSPNRQCGVLYVGGNTGKSDRFRTRVGDLLADMCGFYGRETGHHSGGQSIRGWCKKERANPLDLWIGWQTEVTCKRCAEIDACDQLQPELNKKRPSRCPEHDGRTGH